MQIVNLNSDYCKCYYVAEIAPSAIMWVFIYACYNLKALLLTGIKYKTERNTKETC